MNNKTSLRQAKSLKEILDRWESNLTLELDVDFLYNRYRCVFYISCWIHVILSVSSLCLSTNHWTVYRMWFMQQGQCFAFTITNAIVVLVVILSLRSEHWLNNFRLLTNDNDYPFFPSPSSFWRHHDHDWAVLLLACLSFFPLSFFISLHSLSLSLFSSSHNYCGVHSLARTAIYYAPSKHQNVIIIIIVVTNLQTTFLINSKRSADRNKSKLKCLRFLCVCVCVCMFKIRQIEQMF